MNQRCFFKLILMPLLALSLANGAGAQNEQEILYRIELLSNVEESRAQDYKTQLESLGFVPINLDYRNGRVTLLYGNFKAHADALRAKAQLEQEGFTPGDIVEVVHSGAATRFAERVGAKPTYRVQVDQFPLEQSQQANRLVEELQQKGHLYVGTVTDGDSVKVTVGKYPERNAAQNVLVLLREQGYDLARVIEISPEGRTAPAPPPADERSGPTLVDADQNVDRRAGEVLTPAFTQSDIWQGLNEDQKRKVLNTVILQDRLRQGDELAQRLIDMEKRLAQLDDKTREVVQEIETARSEEEQRTRIIQELFRDANNLARANRYDEAILKIREILKIDPNNLVAKQRLNVLEGLQKGQPYEGYEKRVQEQFAALKAEAQSAERTGTIDGLSRAVNLWAQIKALDPEKFSQTAGTEIDRLNNLIKQKRAEMTQVAAAAERKQRMMWIVALGLSAGVLAALVVLLIIGQRRHRKMLYKIHEITQMRPMRELEGAGAGRVEGGGGKGISAPEESESDIFAPTSQPGDQLTEAEGKPEKEEEETPVGAGAGAAEDRAGEAPPTESSPDIDTDDIFGSLGGDFGDEDKDEEKKEAAPAAASSPEDNVEDIFADLPSVDEEEKSGESAQAKDEGEVSFMQEGAEDQFAVHDIFGEEEVEENKQAAAKQKAEQQKVDDEKESDEMSAISFGDILGGDTGAGTQEGAPADGEEEKKEQPQPTAPAEESQEEDPLSIFNEAVGQSSEKEAKPEPKPAPASAPAQAEESSGGEEEDPFASIFGDETKPTGEGAGREKKEPAQAEQKTDDTEQTMLDDDTEIPAIKLDVPDEDPFADLSLTTEEPPSNSKKEAPPAEQQPQPASGASTTVIPEGAERNGLIFEQTFEDVSVGVKPENWKGDYDYASLNVQDDTPPKGARQYLAYKKEEGSGKVYYATRFPNTSGKFTVEFDLRCNEKNKFLLGFYIEKDEDFQQSIHTKILRTEAQTAPTIHLHGEPAPYLLGSWAHIKYQIDLDEGMVDGYIDSTHIARGLRIPQKPKYLNTLAIRDNVNTTGELFIANIRIQKAG